MIQINIPDLKRKYHKFLIFISTAVDLFPEFLEKLNNETINHNLEKHNKHFNAVCRKLFGPYLI